MSRPFRLLAVAAAVAFLTFLGFIVFSADTGAMPSAIHRLYPFPNGDKVGHFLLNCKHEDTKITKQTQGF